MSGTRFLLVFQVSVAFGATLTTPLSPSMYLWFALCLVSGGALCWKMYRRGRAGRCA
ncbi:MAG: hypothetical protein Q7T01_00750 [bacterium]|nr:hypothetical protein [bacterium]